MKTVLLVNITPLHICNDTLQPVNLTEREKLLNLFSNKYSFVEIYTPLIKLTGKTYKELDEKINNFSQQNNVYNFQSIIIK